MTSADLTSEPVKGRGALRPTYSGRSMLAGTLRGEESTPGESSTRPV